MRLATSLVCTALAACTAETGTERAIRAHCPGGEPACIAALDELLRHSEAHPEGTRGWLDAAACYLREPADRTPEPVSVLACIRAAEALRK